MTDVEVDTDLRCRYMLFFALLSYVPPATWILCATLWHSINFNPQFVPNTQPQSTDGELWLVMTIPNVVFSVQLQHSVTVWQEVKFYYICFFNLTMFNIIAY